MNNPNLTGTRPTKMRFNRNLLSCALVACLALATHDRAVATLAKTFDVLATKRV